MDPENPMCTGTAPMCDWPFFTTSSSSTTSSTTPSTTSSTTSPSTTSDGSDTGECEGPNDVIPYPGDCHKYLMCIDNGHGYDLQVLVISLTKKWDVKSRVAMFFHE